MVLREWRWIERWAWNHDGLGGAVRRVLRKWLKAGGQAHGQMSRERVLVEQFIDSFLFLGTGLTKLYTYCLFQPKKHPQASVIILISQQMKPGLREVERLSQNHTAGNRQLLWNHTNWPNVTPKPMILYITTYWASAGMGTLPGFGEQWKIILKETNYI